VTHLQNIIRKGKIIKPKKPGIKWFHGLFLKPYKPCVSTVSYRDIKLSSNIGKCFLFFLNKLLPNISLHLLGGKSINNSIDSIYFFFLPPKKGFRANHSTSNSSIC